jgi:hypothetical protein
MSWDLYPNLRRRPHAPNKGRGRLQRQIRRVFLIGGPLVSSSQIYDLCFTQRRKATTLKRYMVWRILIKIADPVRKVPPHNAWLWRLRNTEESPE